MQRIKTQFLGIQTAKSQLKIKLLINLIID